MIHHLRTMTIGEFVKGFVAITAYIAVVYALALIVWASRLPEMPQ